MRQHRIPWPFAALLTVFLFSSPASAQPPGEAAETEEPISAPTGEEVEPGGVSPVESGTPEPEPEPTPAAPQAAPPPPAAPPPNPLAIALGPVTLTPSMQVWDRGEVRANDYISDENLHFIIQRARVGLAAQMGFATAFLQMQDVRVFGQAPPGIDGPSFGLHQGYIDLHNDLGYIRLGRQEVNYGTQRMIGALDWTASARSFDGLRLHGNFGKIQVDAFGAYISPRTLVPQGPPPSVPPDPPVSPYPGQYLATADVALNLAAAFNANVYWLSRHDEQTETHIFSPGLRFSGTPFAGLTYDVEGYIQFGERNDAEHFAYAAAGDVFYRSSGPLGLGVDGGASLGSGATQDGDVDQFENFYPTNHKFYGYMDLFGLRNIAEGHIGASIQPSGTNLSLGIRGFLFAQQRGLGAWTNATGGTIGAAGANTSDSRLLGGEADLYATYKPANYLTLNAGYSLFAPGTAAEAFGHDEVQHWAFVWLDLHTP